MWVEPTGSAVAMYSCTTALRIAVFRSSSIWQSTLPSASRVARVDRRRGHRAPLGGDATVAAEHEDRPGHGEQRRDAAVGERPLGADVIADGPRDRATDRRRAEEGHRGEG